MTRVKYFLLALISFFLVIQSNAQYKRRGETLQTRGNTKTNNSKKKADYSLSQLKGKWQEFERMNRTDSTAVPFNDSIQLNFTDSNKVRTRTSVVTSMTLDGEADIDNNNTLYVAADEYTIKSLKNNELVLDDNEKFIHHLKKVDTFWYETLGKLSSKQENFTKTVKVNISAIVGKWSVYRRQAKPGTTSNLKLIKNLNISAKTGANTASGDITFYKDQNIQQVPCTITLSETSIRITAGATVWNMNTYQADANNFVFGNSDLMYFSKK
ncbi:MAG TPA: hypothetical protein VKR53_11340 [Puia sp.]|nr:hypothetical protein [Puia sp.]